MKAKPLSCKSSSVFELIVVDQQILHISSLQLSPARASPLYLCAWPSPHFLHQYQGEGSLCN